MPGNNAVFVMKIIEFRANLQSREDQYQASISTNLLPLKCDEEYYSLLLAQQLSNWPFLR